MVVGLNAARDLALALAGRGAGCGRRLGVGRAEAQQISLGRGGRRGRLRGADIVQDEDAVLEGAGRGAGEDRTVRPPASVAADSDSDASVTSDNRAERI